MHSGLNRAALGGRVAVVAAGILLLVSLFLTWTSLSLQQLALLAVTANGSLGRLSLSWNAWQAYAGVAAALTAVGVLLIVTGVLNRLPLIVPAGLACLAALGFVIVQLADPPSALPTHLGSALPSSGATARSTAGAGETVALIALVLAVIAMWAMLAVADSQRRRPRGGRRHPDPGRRRRQRVTGSAPRSSRPVIPADGPAEGPA